MLSKPGFINNMTIKVGGTIGDPGRSIRRWRTNLGWTQRELARKVGKTQGFISRAELNRVELSNEEYSMIAKAMGLTMERMLSSVC
jgi:transcriptional regulator with XRE-family HTH domain